MRPRKKKPGETHIPGPHDTDTPTNKSLKIALEACLLAADVVYAGSDAFPPLKSAMGAAKTIAEWPAV